MADPRIFFIHIQKTAGGTLRHFIRSNLEFGAVYPEGRFDEEPMPSYWEIDRLLRITPERQEQIRAYIGHFPYIAAELVPVDVVTITTLRHPVERTISYLKMRSRDPQREGMSFEEIYEHPFDFPCFIRDHQAKIFAMTRDDKLETFMDIIEIDDERLEIAKQNLEKVDILGLQERSGEVLQEVADRFGWELGPLDDQHVSPGDWSVSRELLRRIEEDNQADLEFYEFARSLYERRRAVVR